ESRTYVGYHAHAPRIQLHQLRPERLVQYAAIPLELSGRDEFLLDEGDVLVGASVGDLNPLIANRRIGTQAHLLSVTRRLLRRRRQLANRRIVRQRKRFELTKRHRAIVA